MIAAGTVRGTESILSVDGSAVAAGCFRTAAAAAEVAVGGLGCHFARQTEAVVLRKPVVATDESRTDSGVLMLTWT
jgi:hypothetical protein